MAQRAAEAAAKRMDQETEALLARLIMARAGQLAERAEGGAGVTAFCGRAVQRERLNERFLQVCACVGVGASHVCALSLCPRVCVCVTHRPWPHLPCIHAPYILVWFWYAPGHGLPVILAPLDPSATPPTSLQNTLRSVGFANRRAEEAQMWEQRQLQLEREERERRERRAERQRERDGGRERGEREWDRGKRGRNDEVSWGD